LRHSAGLETGVQPMMHGITLPGPGKAKNRGRVPHLDNLSESIEFPNENGHLAVAPAIIAYDLTWFLYMMIRFPEPNY
jgi:hypothetical protein